MTAFSDFYKKTIYRKNAQERLEEINFQLAGLGVEMEKTTDPTMWNRLLDRAEMLKAEQEELAESVTRLNHG
jgi:hypothetical protein